MTTTWHPWQRLHLARARPLTARINPLQAIAPALGVLTMLAGLVAIGHSGFHAEHVYDPHDALAGLHYTPLFAACSMGFGVAMLAGAEFVRLGRSRIRVVGDVALGVGTALLTLASSAAIGFGAVVLADLWPGQLHHALNVDHTGGVIAVIVGAAGLFAAVTAPLTARRAPAAALAPATVSDPPSAPPPRRPAATTTPEVEQEAS
jgi:hypothetical protein